MNPLTRLFRPLRSAAAAFFSHDLALKRGDGGVRIVLEQRPPRPGRAAVANRAELSERKDREELALILQQLAELLNELPETRPALRHLVFVEQALVRKGLRALHKLPIDVLQHALEQLEGLVINWSPVGLASLRSKMAVAIIDREHMDPDAEADAYRTAAVFEAMPADALPEVEVRTDDEALAAAYAGLGDLAPAAVETQAELGSPSARALSRGVTRDGGRVASPPTARPSEIQLRELQG